jgi:transcription antitermination factor NusG
MEMEGVLRSMQQDDHVEPAEMPRPEDRVRILSGPFRGLEGMVVELRGRQRIILSVTLLGRAIAVEVQESALIVTEEPFRLRASA